jgi:hypothetical protein
MSQTASQITAAAHQPLSQLMPFDEPTLRRCMAYVTHARRRSLTQLYIVELNILIDLFHILRTGKPLIGGSVAPWELGPVVPEAYRACDAWKTDYDHFGKHPPQLKVVRRVGRKTSIKAAGPVDLDEFSQSEIDAMQQAWNEIAYLNFAGLLHYTRSPDTFLGSEYTAARSENRAMDWDRIIASYDRLHGEDHSAIRQLIRM